MKVDGVHRGDQRLNKSREIIKNFLNLFLKRGRLKPIVWRKWRKWQKNIRCQLVNVLCFFRHSSFFFFSLSYFLSLSLSISLFI